MGACAIERHVVRGRAAEQLVDPARPGRSSLWGSALLPGRRGGRRRPVLLRSSTSCAARGPAAAARPGPCSTSAVSAALRCYAFPDPQGPLPLLPLALRHQRPAADVRPASPSTAPARPVEATDPRAARADLLDAVFGRLRRVQSVGLGVPSWSATRPRAGSSTPRDRLRRADRGACRPPRSSPAPPRPWSGIALFLDLSCPHCSTSSATSAGHPAAESRGVPTSDLRVPTLPARRLRHRRLPGWLPQHHCRRLQRRRLPGRHVAECVEEACARRRLPT